MVPENRDFYVKLLTAVSSGAFALVLVSDIWLGTDSGVLGTAVFVVFVLVQVVNLRANPIAEMNEESVSALKLLSLTAVVVALISAFLVFRESPNLEAAGFEVAIVAFVLVLAVYSIVVGVDLFYDYSRSVSRESD